MSDNHYVTQHIYVTCNATGSGRMPTFMSAKQLSKNLHYTDRHINEYLKDRVFIEGVHYVRLPGCRRVLYVWEAICADMGLGNAGAIPMANGGVCRG